MWNTIAKYDVIGVYFEEGDEERYVHGEVANLTNSQMVVRDQHGTYFVISRDMLIDVDHTYYADRNEVYRH